VAAVIFDMDGVLVDSEPFGMEAMRRLLAGHGIPYSESDNSEFIGRTTLDCCRILRARHGIASDERTLARGFLDELLRLLRAGPVAMSGVPTVIERLGAAGYRLALASSSESEVIAANLDGLGIQRLFEVVVSGVEVPRGKPAPDIFVETARRLGVAAERCLVVEDSRNGMLAAKAAGMRCIVVPCPATAGQDFTEADARIARLDDLVGHLTSRR
jgi:HAD superfamily hydrolase (TIGR01509 family)